MLRHVVTARVDVRFDAATGTMQLDGAADGPQLRIEDDMLEGELRPERSHYATASEQLNALGDDVWDRTKITPVLKAWAAAIHPDCEWLPDLKPATGGENRPVLSFAPALILRKRTQAGMKRIYNDLIARMTLSPDEVPAGWSSLIDDEDDRDAPPSPSMPMGTTALSSGAEIYFPLPAIANSDELSRL